jgi:hypothetical protein
MLRGGVIFCLSLQRCGSETFMFFASASSKKVGSGIQLGSGKERQWQREWLTCW